MIKSYDIGSLPFHGDFQKFLKGAELYASNPTCNSAKYFKKAITHSFIEKMKVGIEVPNYPQYRDMNKMFFDMIHGVKQSKTGYTQINAFGTKETSIPEVLAIKKNASEI